LEEGFGGIGVVTGAVSRLAVLDFDSEGAYEAFRKRLPQLDQRRLIRTRRGFHLHFQLPPQLRLQSRKGRGVDLLAEGCYAVTWPTQIGDTAYKIARGGMPLLLSLED